MPNRSDQQQALVQQWNQIQNLNGITENAVLPEHLDEFTYEPQTLVDQTLELIDPTPNVYTMFVQFNSKFFWNKLSSVRVRWSQRMTSCAGTCTFHSNNRECVIALSAPLLKLRPRKDLVETLLHEMIHGYLFLTNNNRDRSGHGPEFCKHMNRINAIAGTNITIYHTFHREVSLYKRHWWRCNGPCQNDAPFFGIVRRAMNRPPGPSDFWFPRHELNCGGKFIKIREPDDKENDKSSQSSLSNLKPPKSSSSKLTPHSFSSNNYEPKSPCKDKKKNLSEEFKKLGTNANNVYGFGTGGPNSSTSKSNNNTSTSQSSMKIQISGVVGGTATGKSNLIDKYFSLPNQQKSQELKSNASNFVQCPVCHNNFSNNLIYAHIDQCLINQNDHENSSNKRRKLSDSSNENGNSMPNTSENNQHAQNTCPICHKNFSDDEINSHLDECLLKANINTNSSTKDNKIVNSHHSNDVLDSETSTDLHECPICRNFFIEDTLYDHVNKCLDDEESEDKQISKSATMDKEKKTDKGDIQCPTCDQYIKLVDYTVHVEVCLAAEKEKKKNNEIIVVDDDIYEPGTSKGINTSDAKYKCFICNDMVSKSIPLNEHLDYCVPVTYSDQTILDSSISKISSPINVDNDDSIVDDSEEEEEEEEKHLCPICMKMIEANMMAKHVDKCIKSIH